MKPAVPWGTVKMQKFEQKNKRSAESYCPKVLWIFDYHNGYEHMKLFTHQENPISACQCSLNAFAAWFLVTSKKDHKTQQDNQTIIFVTFFPLKMVFGRHK
ncbi:hypothetical protein AcV7_007652 [Taiwanofungus camphoratus]|nr:hypothetical protein AcV7_007652 [Antrodia cinnamomea]